MATHDIAREGWAEFFDDFSKARQGVMVSIETVAPRTDGPQTQTRALPFVGITFEDKGSGANTIQIMAGTETDDHLTHTVTNPQRVFHKTGAGVMSAEVNPDEVLEITASEDPPITYLRFRREEQ